MMNQLPHATAVLRPGAWWSNWVPGAMLARPLGRADALTSDAESVEQRVVDATPAEVSHRFWQGLLIALPFGVAFWAVVYWLLAT